MLKMLPDVVMISGCADERAHISTRQHGNVKA
jgi:hypothetical protein